MIYGRKGFTLLEMLIAVTVLVILSVTMVFSAVNMTNTADAKNILTNMVQLKTATLMWYKANSSRVILSGSDGYKIKTKKGNIFFSEFINSYSNEITDYIKNKDSINIGSKTKANDAGYYMFIAVNKSHQWYVCYNLAKIESNTDRDAPSVRLREKLAGNAKSFGLVGTNAIGDTRITDTYTGQNYALMLILDLKD